VAADAAVGKRHWVVRLGTARARYGYLLLVVAGWTAAAAVVAALDLGSLGVLPLLPLVLSAIAMILLARHHDRPPALRPAIVCTLLAALSHIGLLAVVLVLAGRAG